MSNSVKLMLYAALVLLAGVSGYFALTNFGRMMAHAGDRTSDLEQIEPERRPAAETPETSAATNTNSLGTNVALLSTNASNTTTLSTNQAVASAIAAKPTNSSASTTSTTREDLPTALSSRPRAVSAKHSSHVAVWTTLFVVSLVALGLLIAGDVAHYFGNKALKVLYNDEGEGQEKDPEYDKAEEIWANGQHLDAIKMMREYLAKNPRQQHVAIRIAEIYEKDLGNNLAAALEYEEVLKHKLAPERWGWAAIHLCNLYFRLNQEQKGFDLLRRIVNEYPSTAAAEKARKRLEQVGEPTTNAIEQNITETHVSAAPRTSSVADPASNLPPGFRPKK